jgi:DNA-binding transcriptional MerR regulator
MNMHRAVKHFSAVEACRFSGLSPTMLDYLTRESFIVPTGSIRRGRGIRRLYTFGDIVTLRVIAQLLRSGIEIRRLRRALRTLQKRMADAKPGQLPFRYLVTDGAEVFFRDNLNVESLTRDGQFAFAFMIDVHRFDRQLTTKDLEQTPLRRRG